MARTERPASFHQTTVSKLTQEPFGTAKNLFVRRQRLQRLAGSSVAREALGEYRRDPEMHSVFTFSDVDAPLRPGRNPRYCTRVARDASSRRVAMSGSQAVRVRDATKPRAKSGGSGPNRTEGDSESLIVIFFRLKIIEISISEVVYRLSGRMDWEAWPSWNRPYLAGHDGIRLSRLVRSD